MACYFDCVPESLSIAHSIVEDGWDTYGGLSQEILGYALNTIDQIVKLDFGVIQAPSGFDVGAGDALPKYQPPTPPAWTEEGGFPKLEPINFLNQPNDPTYSIVEPINFDRVPELSDSWKEVDTGGFDNVDLPTEFRPGAITYIAPDVPKIGLDPGDEPDDPVEDFGKIRKPRPFDHREEPIAPVLSPLPSLPAAPIFDPVPQDQYVPQEFGRIEKFSGIQTPDFSAIRSELEKIFLLDPVVFDIDDFTFDGNEPYDGILLQDTQAKLLEWQKGGTAMSPQTWDAIWDRSRTRIRRIARAAKQQAYSEFASRGFGVPSGLLNARLRRVETDTLGAERALNRDVHIQYAEMEQRNLQFAIAQSIGLVGFLGSMHQQTVQRSFESARYAHQASIQLLQAKIAWESTRLNARIQTIQAAATVFNAELQAELAKVEVYRAELEAEIAKGRINEQRVAIFNTLIQAWAEEVRAEVSVYQAEVQAVLAQSQQVAIEVEIYNGELRAFSEKLRGKSLEYDHFNQQTQAILSKVSAQTAVYNSKADTQRLETEAYRAAVQGASAQVNADISIQAQRAQEHRLQHDVYRSGVENETRKLEAELQANRERIERYRVDSELWNQQAQKDIEAQNNILRVEERKTAEYQTQLQSWNAGIELQSREVQQQLDLWRTTTEQYRAETDVYLANIQNNLAISDQNVKKLDLAIEEGKAQAQIATDQYRVSVAQIARLNELEANRLANSASAYGQLASATMSAVSLSASVRASGNQNQALALQIPDFSEQ